MGLLDIFTNDKVSALMDAKDKKGFSELTDLIEQLVENVPNAEAAMFGLRLALNRVPPQAYYSFYQGVCIRVMYDYLRIPKDREEKVTEILKKLVEIMRDDANSEGIKAFNTMLDNSMKNLLPSRSGFGSGTAEDFDYLLKESIDRVDEPFIKLEQIDGVTLYHGTSYENYLQIVADGKIKASNYETEDYTGLKNIKKVYDRESGFVFVDDSMDKPLGMSFGGYRTNCLDRYFRENKKDSKWNDISVIFEIDPAQYDVYYITYKEEFAILGDVNITGLKKHFFYSSEDLKGKILSEISEEEAKKKWKECTAA